MCRPAPFGPFSVSALRAGAISAAAGACCSAPVDTHCRVALRRLAAGHADLYADDYLHSPLQTLTDYRSPIFSILPERCCILHNTG